MNILLAFICLVTNLKVKSVNLNFDDFNGIESFTRGVGWFVNLQFKKKKSYRRKSYRRLGRFNWINFRNDLNRILCACNCETTEKTKNKTVSPYSFFLRSDSISTKLQNANHSKWQSWGEVIIWEVVFIFIFCRVFVRCNISYMWIDV